ncbi:hypothetical protein [Amphibacillus cookii]|uniref:hypothetical protein n=1 Tax=Amphibacillus cookii TaxID=767787 RepID=UPI001959CB46|nr:hypothetical protein [Amphibacillus cookii]MBM7543005.1 hypothetical protein [Amphibacillus cookii]
MELNVGLICAPELPETICRELIKPLSTYCQDHVDGKYEWTLDIMVDPLTGAVEDSKEIFNEAHKIANQQNWDYTICVTDLLLFDKKKIILADLNKDLNIALLSLPAFGAPPMKNRTFKMIKQIVYELHHQNLNASHIKETATHQMKQKLRLSPIKRMEGAEETNVTRYSVVPKINGKVRAILGMTYANRPWAVIASFKPIIAVAFATGAYVLIFPTLWELSIHYNLLRLVAITFVAIISMIIWMIVSHHLWEKRTKKGKTKMKKLYNTTTLVTLTVAVLAYYIVLLAIFSIAIIFFVPPDLFESLTEIEKDVTLISFLRLSWLATSIATLAGSIGASTESTELIRNIAYGYRQNRRYNEVKERNVQDD